MRLAALCLLFASNYAMADTIDHYMNIATNIPTMEMKADPQAQAWARSARTILSITSESIAETLLEANDLAIKQGKPLFCLPKGQNLSEASLGSLIQQTYRELSSQQSGKDKLTVSQVAWIAVMKNYPCKQKAVSSVQGMQHAMALDPKSN